MKALLGKWKEMGEEKYALYLEKADKNRRPAAIIFLNSESGHYTYSLNFNRYVASDALKAKTLEEAKKEVESIIHAELDDSFNSIVLSYNLEYYILIFDDRNVVIDNKHIQGCPPERFRDEKIKELKKRKGVTEIWQCHGIVLAEMIKTVVYRENDNISTIYDAVRYSGRMIWRRYKDEKV